MPTLTQDDVRGRRLDLLGQQQQIALDSDTGAGLARTLFTTGDIAFRAGGQRIFIAYVFITLEDGATAFNSGTIVRIGITGTPDNWLGGSFDLSLLASPYLLWANMAGANTALLPVYDVGVPFIFTNASSGVVGRAQTATVSCYGWAEN